MRIKWHYTGNEAICHVDVALPTQSRAVASNTTVTRLLMTIGGIAGVVSFSCEKYSLALTKGVVFQWDEINYKVEDALLKYAGCDTVERVG